MVRLYWPVLLWLGTTIVQAIMFYLSRRFASVDSLEAVRKNVAEVRTNLDELRHDIESLPTREELSRLRLEMSEMRGELKTLRAELKPVNHLAQLLLEQELKNR